MTESYPTCYEQFLLFPQCFQKACFPAASKGVIVREWVNQSCDSIKEHKESMWLELQQSLSLFRSQKSEAESFPSYLAKVKLSIFSVISWLPGNKAKPHFHIHSIPQNPDFNPLPDNKF